MTPPHDEQANYQEGTDGKIAHTPQREETPEVVAATAEATSQETSDSGLITPTEDEDPASGTAHGRVPGASPSKGSVPASSRALATEHLAATAAASGEAPPPAPANTAAPVAKPASVPGAYVDVMEENARLREENARLRQGIEQARTGAILRRKSRVRRTSVGILLVLTCLGMLLSSLTLWINHEFLNTDTWVALVGPLGHDPHVVDAVSAYAADEVVTLLDVKKRAQEALPPRAQFLSVPLTTVVHNFAQTSVQKLMHTPQFQQVWIATNRYVQAEVLAALRGQTRNVIIENGTVTLNLIPVINQALKALQQTVSGLLPANVHLPDISQLQIPSQARARLSQALGVQVPANFGTIALFSSEQLAKAQQVLRIFDLLTVLLPIVTVLLFVAALWFSPDRRRSLIQFGIGVAIVFLLARIVTGYLEGQVIAGITNPIGQSIAGAVIPAALSGLLAMTVLLLVAGIVAAILAYLVGKPEWFAAGYTQSKLAYGQLRTWYGQVRGT